MTVEKQPRARARYFKQLILAEFAIFAIIGGVWWFMGEQTIKRLSDLGFLIGAGIMFIGAVSSLGTRGSTGSFRYQFASTASEVDLHQRVNQDWKDRFSNEGGMLQFIILGGIPFAAGILIGKLFG